MQQKLTIRSIITTAVATIFLSAFLVFAAWTEPNSVPPTCPSGDPGCDSPINVSATTQGKDGGLILGDNGGPGGFTVLNGNSFFLGNIAVGTLSPDPGVIVDIVGGLTKTTGGLIIETRTSDPASPEVGRMWLRTDF